MPTIPAAPAIAVARYQAGRLRDAEQSYRKIRVARPNHPQALHLLGVIAWQVGNPQQAARARANELARSGDPARELDTSRFARNVEAAYRAMRQR